MTNPTTEPQGEIDWSLTTWEGSRREQLRRWCSLTLRERLEALDDMTLLVEHFQQMRSAGKFSSPPPAPRREAHAGHQATPQYGPKVDDSEPK